MRYLLVGLVLVGGVGSASADPSDYTPRWERPGNSGTFVEVGAGWMRENPDGVTYRAKYLRFAPQISINRWFYVGAAFQVGQIYDSSGTLDGQLPAKCSVGGGLMCTGGNDLIDESTGTIVEPQAFLGVRNRIGIVSGAFELAPTVRWTTASTNYLNESFTTSVRTIELHARGDVWATPHFNAGVMVGADFNRVRNFEVGLQIGFHFEPYDAMNR